ncbi:MAG TPA: hypothetical protein VGB26_04955 [Nitrospiria bacterium]|jgi:hypothetical protein
MASKDISSKLKSPSPSFSMTVHSEKFIRVIFISLMSFELLLVFFAIAIGIDFVEGMERGFDFVAESFSWDSQTVRHFGKVFGEFLEMLETTFFLICFLEYFIRIAPEMLIRFQSAGTKIQGGTEERIAENI